MEDELPIGTEVAVFLLDEVTFLEYGVIEAYVPLGEIPDDQEVADTRPTGQNEQITEEEKKTLQEFFDSNSDLLIPRIKLESGKITYGCVCYFMSREEYDTVQKTIQNN